MRCLNSPPDTLDGQMLESRLTDYKTNIWISFHLEAMWQIRYAAVPLTRKCIQTASPAKVPPICVPELIVSSDRVSASYLFSAKVNTIQIYCKKRHGFDVVNAMSCNHSYCGKTV